MEATIALNKKLVSGNVAVATGKTVGKLYVKGVKPLNKDLIEDLNAEIAMEIERNSTRAEQIEPIVDTVENYESNGFGVGEIPVEVFKGVEFPFIGALLPEFLMKVFKLYIGYNREGVMTPVLVFLTNKTLYVTDLVRSTLCNKFVMPYSELDVILVSGRGIMFMKSLIIYNNPTHELVEIWIQLVEIWCFMFHQQSRHIYFV